MKIKLVNTKEALLKIYQAIGGSRQRVFNPLMVLKGLSNEKLILLKIYGFKKQGYLFYKPDVLSCQLTELGLNKALRQQVKHSLGQKKWDGGWRFLIFDVPEEYKKYREKLRRTLIEMGCQKVQLSIWVSPYDILEELKLLLPSFRIGDWVQIVKSKDISNYEVLVKNFGLDKKYKRDRFEN